MGRGFGAGLSGHKGLSLAFELWAWTLSETGDSSLNHRSSPAQWDRSVRATLVSLMRDDCLFNTLAFFSSDPLWIWQITQRS